MISPEVAYTNIILALTSFFWIVTRPYSDSGGASLGIGAEVEASDLNITPTGIESTIDPAITTD